MKLTDPQKRMLRNVAAAGENGIWVHGRSELSTAKALERRGFIRIEKEKKRTGEVIIAMTMSHVMATCNCYGCRINRGGMGTEYL